MKTLKTMAIVILALILSVNAAFAVPENPAGGPNKEIEAKSGRKYFQKLKAIDEKYKADPQYQQMKDELKTLRQAFMKDMKAIRDSGATPDKAAVSAKMDAHRAKLNAIETKYGSKYPDFFQTMKEIRQNRMRNRKRQGAGMQNLQTAIKKYGSDPEFKTMMDSMKKDRDAFRSEMQALRASGATPDREAAKAKIDAQRKKMESYETRYGAKYPDFFKAIREMRQNGRKMHKMNGKGGGKVY